MRMSESVLAKPVGSLGLRARPSVLRMVGNETIKGLLTTKANWGTLVPGLAVLVVFYFFVQFLIGNGRLLPALYAPTLLGFAAYSLAYIVSLKTVAGTLEEMNAGTLEQVHLSPLPSWALSFGRLVASVLEAVGMTAVVSSGLILVLGIRFAYRLDALLPIALTIIDVAGFSLLLGALAIRVASIGAILHVLQGVVLLLNGSFVPVNAFPDWLQLFSRLLPTTLGVEVSRRILLQGWTLSATWSDMSLLWLTVHTAVMLTLGGVFYQRNIMRALHEGRLGPR